MAFVEQLGNDSLHKGSLVSWCFEPSRPHRVISGLFSLRLMRKSFAFYKGSIEGTNSVFNVCVYMYALYLCRDWFCGLT